MQDQSFPADWQLANLGDLSSDISYGYTASATLEPTGVRLLRITDIQNNSVNWSAVPYCQIETNKIDKYRLRTGDLVFARTGATVGKSYLLKGNIPDSVYASYLIRVRCLEGISIEYLSAYFQSSYYWRQITDFSAGIGQPNVNGTKLKNLSVPVPPLAEQKVIADKLDTLLAQVENTKARLERIPQILKRFRQSVLAAAVSGRLTEEWRNDNATTPVKDTLDDIASERARITKGKAKISQAHLKQEEFPIPDSWKWVSLDSLAKKIVDGTHHTPKYVSQGIPFISVKDVKGGKVSFRNTKFISELEHAELKKRCPVENGDLLITKSGTIGRTAVVNTDQPFSIFVSVALIKPVNPKVNVSYIDLALRKWVNEIDVSSRIVGSAIKNLHLRDMKVLAVPFAPAEEQTEIVRRVDQLFAHADRIEHQVNNALARVNNLTQSILAKAFRGELTEQWREDNPELISGENSAKALLESMAVERAANNPPKNTRKSSAAH